LHCPFGDISWQSAALGPPGGTFRLSKWETERMIEMKLPYKEPLVLAEPGDRVIPEPPRKGEPGGEPCRICAGATTPAVWSDDLWTLHPPVGGSLPGVVWLASREHVDSFADLPPAAAEDFGKVAARVERAILSLGGIARVHLNRWGDGGAHFHVWFIPRPLGMLEAQGMMLPLWEDVLPNVSDDQLREAAERVAARMDDTGLLTPRNSSDPS
jgi:diadenosine tetraphosphate (Ap4A) HIT family hydrolase